MNKTLGEALAFAQILRGIDWRSPPYAGVLPFVIPPFTALAAVSAALRDTPVLVGAQTMHWEDAGAWTGEISPVMLRDCGAALVELGHSERRAHFAETDEAINRKVAAALRHGLRPLICVGESAAERRAGRAGAVLGRQVELALRDIPAERARDVLIAYEPVWAIGHDGTPAEPCYVAAMIAALRAALPAPFAGVSLLYGGSVDAANALAYARIDGVDGLFVGRAAWEVEGFLRIVRAVGMGSAPGG
jgi:triosephosphate isomerase